MDGRYIRSESRARRVFPAILVFAALLLCSGAVSLPLFDPDEARFARTSLEMLRSGDLVVPTFEGEPRLVKPPLLHWLQAALFSALGPREWVARVPAIVATLLALWITGWVGRRKFGEQGAVWASVCLISMPLFAVAGRHGTLDALLMLHVWAVVAYDLDCGDDEDLASHGWVYGLLLGLAFLIKGPVGVVLPLLMVLAGRTASGRTVAPRLKGVLTATAAWALVVLPWGLAFLGRVGGTGAGSTLREEVLGRFVAGTAHEESAVFYLPVLAVAALVWLTPFCFSLYRVVRHARDPETRTARYLAAAWLVGLVLFSISRSKVPTYLLPLFPAMALLVSWEFARESARPRATIRAASFFAATAGALGIALGVVAAGRLDGRLALVAGVGALVYSAAAIASMPALLRRRPWPVWCFVATAQAIFLMTALWIVPLELSQKRTSAWLIKELPALRSGRPVAIIDMRLPSLTWYLDAVPERIVGVDLGAQLAHDRNHFYVFDLRDWEVLAPETKARLEFVAAQGKYAVYELPSAKKPGRLTP